MAEAKLPTYNMGEVERLRKKLLTELPRVYAGTQLSGEAFDTFVTFVHELLPARIERKTVFSSLLPMLDSELKPVDIRQLCWRLAGNVKRLRQGIPAAPWSGIPDMCEWVPLQIIDVVNSDTAATPRKQPGFILQFRVLAGGPCPARVERYWSRKYIMMLHRKMGFTSPWKRGELVRYPFKSGIEFMNMRIYGYIDPQYCQDRQPGFYRVSVSSGCVQWNRRILRARIKIDPPCPREYKFACYQCWVGLDQCPAACRVKSLPLKEPADG